MKHVWADGSRSAPWCAKKQQHRIFGPEKDGATPKIGVYFPLEKVDFYCHVGFAGGDLSNFPKFRNVCCFVSMLGLCKPFCRYKVVVHQHFTTELKIEYLIIPYAPIPFAIVVLEWVKRVPKHLTGYDWSTRVSLIQLPQVSSFFQIQLLKIRFRGVKKYDYCIICDF